jgi:N6-adenosine-specific RNA methylase IME4
VAYRTITADPPWLERGGGKVKRGADRHYDLLPTEEIPRVMMNATMSVGGKHTRVWQPDTSCHLYLWVTNNFLKDGLWVMERLGFRYVTNVAWVKGVACGNCNGWGVDDNEDPEDLSCERCMGTGMEPPVKVQQGLGQYFRGSHELLLFGVKGKFMRPAKALPSVIVAPRTKHSRKPEEAFELIEATSPGPRLEMFSRAKREGWDVFGNDAALEAGV